YQRSTRVSRPGGNTPRTIDGRATKPYPAERPEPRPSGCSQGNGATCRPGGRATSEVSGEEEDRLAVSLQADVEHVAALAVLARDQGVAPVLGHGAQHRVRCVERLVREVHPGDGVVEHAAGEDRHVDVGRL